MQYAGAVGAVPETRVLTVPTAYVNEELHLRKAFGWQLVQASARSFATGGGIVAAGLGYQGFGVGAGRISLDNAHCTDLVLTRRQNGYTRELAELEARFDSLVYEREPSKIPSVTLAVAGLVISLMTYLILGPELALPDWTYWIPAVIFGIAALWIMARRTMNVEAANDRVTALKQSYLDRARRVTGG